MTLGDWYLNGTKLCPWNFELSESYEVVGEEERILSGLLRRDIVARKKNFELAWETLPETFDGTYHCYADLEALGTKSGTMAFIRPTGTGTGTTSQNVYCSVPEGELAHRAATDVYWNVGITLRQA